MLGSSAFTWRLPRTLKFSVVPWTRNWPPALYRNRTSAHGPACLRGNDTAQAPLHLCFPHLYCAHVGATGLQHHRRERQRLEGPFFAPPRSVAEAARLHPAVRLRFHATKSSSIR